MDEATRYNKIYSEHETPYGHGKPERVVEDILKYRTSGFALEIGAGEGRNTLFLAAHGFTVRAVDISEVGISKIEKAAKEKDLLVETEVSDVRTLDLEKDFDVLVSTFMLHHLSRSEALALIQKLQKHTLAGGLNAITVFTKNGDFYNANPGTDKFYPEKDELKRLYDGWNILEYEEFESGALQKKPDGTPMLNITARILAMKDEANGNK